MKFPKTPSLRVLAPMLIILKYLAIFPPYSFGRKPTSTKFQYKVYNFFFLIFLILAYMYHIYGKLTCDQFDSWDPTLNVVDYICNLFLTGVSLLTCISTLKKCDRLKQFVYSLEMFDKVSKKPYREKKMFLTMAPVLKCFTLAIIVIDSFTYGRAVTMEVYKYFIVRSIFWYHFCESLFFKFWMCHEILFRFQYLNELLLEKMAHYNQVRLPAEQVFKVKSTEERKREASLRNLIQWYSDMCNIVDIYNEVFGTILLGSVLYNISFILQAVVVVLVGVVFKKESNLKATYYLIASGCWLLKALLQLITFADICHTITQEASKITTICYSFLRILPTIPKNECDIVLKSELFFLIQQSVHRRPVISAAGFFDINLGMLGFIVGSVTSYIVVSVQFVAN